MLSLFLVYFVKQSRWFCFDLNALGCERVCVCVFVHTSVVMNSKWMWYCVQYQVEKVFFCSASGFIKKSTYHRIYMYVSYKIVANNKNQTDQNTQHDRFSFKNARHQKYKRFQLSFFFSCCWCVLSGFSIKSVTWACFAWLCCCWYSRSFDWPLNVPFALTVMANSKIYDAYCMEKMRKSRRIAQRDLLFI